MESQHFGLYLDGLDNDFQRAQACRAKAEGLRNKWYEGLREAIADALIDPDLRNFTAEQKEITGESRWSLTKRSKDLAGAEQMYWRWMAGYLDWHRERVFMRSPVNVAEGSAIAQGAMFPRP